MADYVVTDDGAVWQSTEPGLDVYFRVQNDQSIPVHGWSVASDVAFHAEIQDSIPVGFFSVTPDEATTGIQTIQIDGDVAFESSVDHDLVLKTAWVYDDPISVEFGIGDVEWFTPTTYIKWGQKRWGTFLWGDLPTTNMTAESLPSDTTTTESVTGRGSGQYGAWTETDQYGAWTDFPPYGALTSNDSYFLEVRPSNTFTTKDKPKT